MTTRLAVLALTLAAAAGFATTAPAYAEEICHSVRVDLINDWVYCVSVTPNGDGSVTVGFYCDMAQNACPNRSVTVP